MGQFSRRWTALVVLGLVVAAVPCLAAPIPSRAADPPALDTSGSDRAAIEGFLGREDVARALAARGLTPQEAESRLARLSPEDVSALAANLDQIQAAGEVPKYIWILLAILMGVTILATVF
jgi:ParB-like chromosome segregation protein Spo0J